MTIQSPHSAFVDKIAVITGAASGIGRETAIQLLASGAKVVACDRDPEGLKSLRENFEARYGENSRTELDVHVVDVSDTKRLREFIDGAVELHGRIDYMFNNAGIAGKSGEVRDLEVEDWERMVDINLMAVIHGTSFAYAHMRKQGSGHVINMASAAGLFGLPSCIPYSTTKAAVVAFSRDLRSEASTFGVDVTVLCPGFVESRIFENASTGTIDLEKSKEAIPVKFVPVEAAVVKILKGVLARDSIVAFPSYVRVLWLLRRLAPRLYDRLLGPVRIREGRKSRLDQM